MSPVNSVKVIPFRAAIYYPTATEMRRAYIAAAEESLRIGKVISGRAVSRKYPLEHRLEAAKIAAKKFEIAEYLYQTANNIDLRQVQDPKSAIYEGAYGQSVWRIVSGINALKEWSCHWDAVELALLHPHLPPRTRRAYPLPARRIA